MNKNLIAGIAVFLLLIYPAKAATEFVYVDLFFNIASVDELTVTLLGQSTVTSAPAGTATPANIEFNFTSGTVAFINATVVGGSTQDSTNPILSLDNTGTTNLLVNISVNATLPSGTCTMFLRSLNDSAAYSVAGLTPAANGSVLDTGNNVTIDTSFTPAEATWGIWLYANVSGCVDSDDTIRRFRIWAVTV